MTTAIIIVMSINGINKKHVSILDYLGITIVGSRRTQYCYVYREYRRSEGAGPEC